jgi:hypothetical protein
MRPKPFVFIGSSTEGINAAKGIQANLEFSCECQIWSQGLFGLSGGTLGTLVKALDKFDFAILVLTEDDITISRQVGKNSPRDNVIFELGLFIGGLGLDRTFIVVDREAELKLPSDLGGITPATFVHPIKGTIQSALGTACLEIEQKISNVGCRLHSAVTAHWFKKYIEDGRTENPDFFMTVFNRTDHDLPWLNVHVFPSNTFKLEPITAKKDRMMPGQYAMYQFRMFESENSLLLTTWALRFSEKKEEEISIRIFGEDTWFPPLFLSYDLGAELHQRIINYKKSTAK